LEKKLLAVVTEHFGYLWPHSHKSVLGKTPVSKDRFINSPELLSSGSIIDHDHLRASVSLIATTAVVHATTNPQQNRFWRAHHHMRRTTEVDAFDDRMNVLTFD